MLIRGTGLWKLSPKDSDFKIQVSGGGGVSHFNTSEFRCHHCGYLILHYDLVAALEKLRIEIGKPLVLTSGYRCPVHNKAIGGVTASGHTKGYAADIALPADYTHELFREVIWSTRKITGIKRVGSYPEKHFCHVGVRSKLFGKRNLAPRWGYWEKKKEFDNPGH